jgi:hypothetical protein
MQTAQVVAQNSVHTGTFLDSRYLDPGYLFNHFFPFVKNFWIFISSDQTLNVVKTILVFLAMFFIAIICYTFIRLLEIRKKEHAHLHHEMEEYMHNKIEYEKHLREEVGGSKNERWSKTLNYIFSQHGSDWKLAIIEADSMLEGLLDHLGFKGDNLGDKLKSANQDSFPYLSTAWEIHTIRNRIAHEGLAFELSQHEAKRIIALYEQIFHSYGFI